MADHSLLLLPGDGIGPEAIAQVEKLLTWINATPSLSLQIAFEQDAIGGTAFDKYGVPLADETLEKARNVDAILLGAVGGPQWDTVPYEKRPEAGLLKLRKELDLFANLRPALVFDALIDASSLKPEIIQGLDILIVRELTGGIYFGEPRGIETLPSGEKRGFNTQSYTSSEIQRITHVAFDLARKRTGKVCSAEKGNVMESGRLWREEVTKLHQETAQDIELSHMYADAMAMQLVRAPKQFDVIVTDNLFGDLLSDEAAMLTGSLGMLPSASLGAPDQTGKRHAVYEPVHGSAPDIAGQNKANPLATILSFAMLLRYSFDQTALAEALELAVQDVLADGIYTPDLQLKTDASPVSTDAMGDAVLRAFQKRVS